MLLLLLPLLPLLATIPHLCSAASLIISIPPSTQLPNPNTLPPSTHATLLSSDPQVPPISTPLTVRSTIEFHNLSLPASPDSSAQSYLLTISALSHVFACYRVDIIPGGSADGGAVIEGIWETYPGSAWSDRGPILGGKAAQGGGASGRVVNSAGSGSEGPAPEQEPGQEQTVRIDAKVLSQREFYEQRAGFNPLGLLMNPMVLLGVVAMAITFGMPYLMDNIDPDLKAEFQEQQKNSPLAGMHSALQAAASGGGGGGGGGSTAAGVGGGGPASNFDLASWMAGAGKSAQGQGGVSSSGVDPREGGGARRR